MQEPMVTLHGVYAFKFKGNCSTLTQSGPLVVAQLGGVGILVENVVVDVLAVGLEEREIEYLCEQRKNYCIIRGIQI